MLAKALYTVTIDRVAYTKGKKYEIKKQITIAGKDYFEFLKEEKKSKNKKPDDKKVEEKKEEVLVEGKKEDKKVEEKGAWENFDNLEK